MTLKGAPELHRRLTAIKRVLRDEERQWQSATVAAAQRRIPVRTGATRASIHGSGSGSRVKVVGKYTVNFIDAGSKAHDEPRGRRRRGRVSKVLRFNVGGQTIFRRKVHKRSIPARPFKKAAAREGLAKLDLLKHLIDLWNRAA